MRSGRQTQSKYPAAQRKWEKTLPCLPKLLAQDKTVAIVLPQFKMFYKDDSVESMNIWTYFTEIQEAKHRN